MGKNLEWGEAFWGNEHAVALSCTNKECKRSNNFDYVTKKYHATTAIGIRKHGNEPKPYALLCECPSCFTKYWFHINYDEAKEIAESHSNNSKNF